MPPSWAGGTLGPGLVPRSAGSCLLSTVLKQLLVHLSRCCEGRSRRSPGEGEFAIRPGTGTSVRCLFAFKSPKSACLLMIEVFFFFFISVETYGSFARFQGSRCSEVPRSTFAPRVGHAVAPFLWSTYALRSGKNSRIAPWTSSLRVASLPLGDSAWLFRHRTPGLILSLCL